MAINEKIENKLKELLRVIDIELCDLTSDNMTIKDLLYPNEFNEVIGLPVDYKTADDLRVFRSYKINENYFFSVLNTKYPKTPFNKNGVEFNINMSKAKDEEKISLELFHNDNCYLIFIGQKHDEKYICCRIKNKEWIDFSYIINPENERSKKEMTVSFDSLSTNAKKIAAIDSKDESFLRIQTLTEEKHSISSNDINRYFNAIATRLKDIMSSIIEVISITNENFLDIIYSDFPIVEEFINMTNSEIEDEMINRFFDDYAYVEQSVTKDIGPTLGQFKKPE